MNTKKNKIVFGGIVLTVILFIGVYAYSLLGKEDSDQVEANRIPVPELEDEQKTYESKLEALDDLKEVRESNAPSIYDERLLDSTGTYDPDLLDKEKMRIVDSIYRQGRIQYSETPKSIKMTKPEKRDEVSVSKFDDPTPGTADITSDHASFFLVKKLVGNSVDEDQLLYAKVNGKQLVKRDYRLELVLTKEAVVSGHIFPKHTPIYGFVSFKPNRVHIEITNINGVAVKLKAYDVQDGNEGIYVPNNFRAEAGNAVVDDAIDQINIPSVPSAGVLKRVFQRSNKHIRATITDNYELILKPSL